MAIVAASMVLQQIGPAPAASGVAVARSESRSTEVVSAVTTEPADPVARFVQSLQSLEDRSLPVSVLKIRSPREAPEPVGEIARAAGEVCKRWVEGLSQPGGPGVIVLDCRPREASAQQQSAATTSVVSVGGVGTQRPRRAGNVRAERAAEEIFGKEMALQITQLVRHRQPRRYERAGPRVVVARTTAELDDLSILNPAGDESKSDFRPPYELRRDGLVVVIDPELDSAGQADPAAAEAAAAISTAALVSGAVSPKLRAPAVRAVAPMTLGSGRRTRAGPARTPGSPTPDRTNQVRWPRPDGRT